MLLAWKAALATSLVNDDVAFEIRHRVESTIVMRLEILLPPFAKPMSLSREVEQRSVRRNLCVESAPLWGQGADALVVADESREPEVMSRDALGSTTPAVA
jgi:hypothetical protein